MFLHDEKGAIVGIGVKNAGETRFTHYYYAKNLQGDVVAIYRSDYNSTSQTYYPTLVASYEYDPWGKVTSVKGSSGAILSLETYPNHIAHVNPIRYRGYYYDNETGFYYLQSRYYDPAISRFINADSYGSTGQAFLGTNMFAYCGNNPVNMVDPSGHFGIGAAIIASVIVAVTLSGCSAKTSSDSKSYESADAAAIAFATSIYSSSLYTRHEYSTEIYSVTTGGKTLYYYTEPAVGAPHRATGIDMGRVPANGTAVAYAHTHPNGYKFSSADTQFADYYKINAYVVCPDFSLQCYNYSDGSQNTLCQIFPDPLTDDQKRDLLKLRTSWDAHFKEDGTCPGGWGCERMAWPNW